MYDLICDTNVWYQIANKNIKPSDLEGLHLYGTDITCTELSSTPRLISDLTLITNVVKAMNKYHHKMIMANPVEHLIKIFFNDYVQDVERWDQRLNSFNILMNADLSTIPEESIIIAQHQINQIVETLNKFADNINEGLIKIRERILKLEGRKKHIKADHLKTWKEFISEFVRSYSLEYCDREYVIDIEDNNWNQVECFIHTWEKYFKLLESENRKFDRNDWADLFNLVYVQPGFKYWTFEKKWNYILKEDKLLKNYFYNQNGS